MTIRGHQIIHRRSLRKYLEELVYQDFLKEYVLTPRATSDAGKLSALPPTQLQHMIIQYKMIE